MTRLNYFFPLDNIITLAQTCIATEKFLIFSPGVTLEILITASLPLISTYLLTFGGSMIPTICLYQMCQFIRSYAKQVCIVSWDTTQFGGGGHFICIHHANMSV